MRAVLLSMGIVLAGLLGLLALEGGDAPAARPARPAASVATIAARVEALRGLRFDSRPVPQRVSPAQARREGLEDLDRAYPESRRKADEEVLKLLGLIEPDVDLRSISASVFGEGVAGYYDPRSKRLRIVSGTTPDALERDGARARAHARARGSALRARARGGGERRRRARPARPRRGLGDARHAAVPAAPHRDRAGPERAARVRAADRARAAAVPRGPADLPLPERARSSSRRCSAQGGGIVEARRPRRPRARAGEHRAGPAPGEVGRRREAAAGAAGRRARRRLATHRARDLGRVADARAARAATETRPPRAGAGTATSSGSAGRAPRRRAATPTCW